MDASSLEALVFDPSKCSKLSMEQKRELVYEISKWSDSAAEMLQAWSRQEILQILCAELGKERKYTGLTKSKMIDHLLKIVCEKTQERGSANVSEAQPSSENGERTLKRQKKSDQCSAISAPDDDSGDTTHCKNSACKAKMNSGDEFCKRCSCCICHKYDDNKDPSLWLICNSDPPFNGRSCGMSCHLECALRHENSGISKDHMDKGLDGSFCCVSCGKVNDLLGSWKKQMVAARDTRRVDELCYRLSLGQKILAGTKHHQNLYAYVVEAVQKLEEDMGPLTGIPVKKARGIVNRLSSGPEIQKFCASAVECLDLMLSNRVFDSPSDGNALAAKLVRFEDIRATSLAIVLNSEDSNLENIVGYNLWHRKSDDIDYPAEPTCRFFTSNTKYLFSGLTPATQYFIKVVTFDTDGEMGSFEFQVQTLNYEDKLRNLSSNNLEIESSQSPATNCSSLSNPSSVEDETNNVIVSKNDGNTANLLGDTLNCSDQSQKEITGDIMSLSNEEHSMGTKTDALIVKNKESFIQIGAETSIDNGSKTPLPTGMECVPYVDMSKSGLPITPCNLEKLKEGSVRTKGPKLNGKEIDVASERGDGDEPQAGSSSKKRSEESRDEECNGIGDKGFEYYVKVIRNLERGGHVETTFRQKFLTWFSLRATSQETRIVKVFIDTFVEDPESLAGQLVDTFADIISNKKCSSVPAGFCVKLWH